MTKNGKSFFLVMRHLNLPTRPSRKLHVRIFLSRSELTVTCFRYFLDGTISDCDSQLKVDRLNMQKCPINVLILSISKLISL